MTEGTGPKNPTTSGVSQWHKSHTVESHTTLQSTVEWYKQKHRREIMI